MALSKRIVSDDGNVEESMLVKLDERLLQTPGFALAAVRQEINKMGKLVLDNVKYSCDFILHQKNYNKLMNNQENIIKYGQGISAFLQKIDTATLTPLEQTKLKNSILCLSDIERIGDHCIDVIETVEGWMINKKFSKVALDNIEMISTQAYNTVKCALEMRVTKNTDLNTQVMLYARNVHQMEESMREGHNQRLLEKQCNVEIGVTYLDTLYNYDRIATHAQGIAQYTLEEEK